MKNGRVYTMPNSPFAWLDRPPGVNRFIGIQWLANVLYPDLYDVDMVEATQEFYRRMYWIELSDDQALELLGNSYPAPGKTAKYTPSQEAQQADAENGLSADELAQRRQGVD